MIDVINFFNIFQMEFRYFINFVDNETVFMMMIILVIKW
jgi:hypothetical protein